MVSEIEEAVDKFAKEILNGISQKLHKLCQTEYSRGSLSVHG